MKRAVTLLRSLPNFRRLWLGNSISQAGDWIGWVAISVLALHAGGGLLELALVFAAHHLPTALLAPVAGPLSDRVDRRALLLWTVWLQAGLTALMVVVALAGGIAMLPWILLLRSSALAFFIPAERAALPPLVEKDELLLAGALDSGTWSVIFALGMAVGGMLSALGPVLALIIDSFTFVAAAAMFHKLPTMAPESAPDEPESRTGAQPAQVVRRRAVWLAAGFVDDIRAGWRHIWPRAEIARAVLAKSPLALAGGSAWLALNAVAAQAGSVEATAMTLGVLHALRGVGTGLGPLLGAVLITRDRSRYHRVWHGLYAAGLIGMAIFALSPMVAAPLWLIAAPAAVLWGVGSGGNWVLASESIQRLVADRFLGRASSLDAFAAALAMTVGVVGTAVLIEASGAISIGTMPGIAAAVGIWLWLSARVDSATSGASHSLAQA